MKQLGIDPVAIRDSAEKVGAAVQNISERMTALEAQSNRIEQKLDAILGASEAPLEIAAPTQQHEA